LSKRKKIPKDVETAVLLKSKRRCCVCFFLNGDNAVKKGQIAHLDGNPSNCVEENLAFLCFNHHDEYDSQSSQSKRLTEEEVKHFRDELHKVLHNTQHDSNDVNMLVRHEEELLDEGSATKLENREPIPMLRIIGIENGSAFYRTVASASNNSDKDTLLCFKIRVINNGSRYTNIAQYEVIIPSHGYQEEPQPISDREEVRFRTGKSSSAWLTIHNLADHEGLIRIEPSGGLKTGNLYFRIPIILPKETHELKCKLKLWDYDNRGGHCEIKLTKEGY